MIERMEKLHVSALAGLLSCINNQEGIDMSYDLIKDHLQDMQAKLHEVLYIVAGEKGLNARPINNTNLQTRLDIEAQLRKEESNV